jgi:hypothetical protein
VSGCDGPQWLAPVSRCNSLVTIITVTTLSGHHHGTISAPLRHRSGTVTAPFRHRSDTVSAPFRHRSGTITALVRHRYVTITAPDLLNVASVRPRRAAMAHTSRSILFTGNDNYCYGTVTALSWHCSGTVPAPLRHHSGTVPASFRHRSGTIPVPLRHRSGTVPVLVRYHHVTITAPNRLYVASVRLRRVATALACKSLLFTGKDKLLLWHCQGTVPAPLRHRSGTVPAPFYHSGTVTATFRF